MLDHVIIDSKFGYVVIRRTIRETCFCLVTLCFWERLFVQHTWEFLLSLRLDACVASR